MRFHYVVDADDWTNEAHNSARRARAKECSIEILSDTITIWNITPLAAYTLRNDYDDCKRHWVWCLIQTLAFLFPENA